VQSLLKGHGRSSELLSPSPGDSKRDINSYLRVLIRGLGDGGASPLANNCMSGGLPVKAGFAIPARQHFVLALTGIPPCHLWAITSGWESTAQFLVSSEGEAATQPGNNALVSPSMSAIAGLCHEFPLFSLHNPAIAAPYPRIVTILLGCVTTERRMGEDCVLPGRLGGC